eukprot:scaffold10321_cov122-Isochrysis_galbana.AAC.3
MTTHHPLHHGQHRGARSACRDGPRCAPIPSGTRAPYPLPTLGTSATPLPSPLTPSPVGPSPAAPCRLRRARPAVGPFPPLGQPSGGRLCRPEDLQLGARAQHALWKVLDAEVLGGFGQHPLALLLDDGRAYLGHLGPTQLLGNLRLPRRLEGIAPLLEQALDLAPGKGSEGPGLR